jgi:hypothetical protein
MVGTAEVPDGAGSAAPMALVGPTPEPHPTAQYWLKIRSLNIEIP